jgi:Ca2+/Na+ antiporter
MQKQFIALASLSFYILILLMHQREMSVVRFAMFVLFSAIMIVYLVLYQIKGEQIKEQLNTFNADDQWISTWTTGSYQTQREENNQTQEKTMENKNTSWSREINDKINILSGTSLWYGRVDAAENLGISYQYALKDQNDIYYVFIDSNKKEKIEEIVKALWWTTYTISTEKDILENKLFWDKVTFINLPEYKEQKVVILVENNKDLRLLQINYSIYHKSKWYIQQLFIK